MTKKTLLLALLLTLSILLFSGCTQPGPKQTPTPITVTPLPGYSLSFEFEEGSALFNKARLNVEIDGKSRLKQEMETVSIVLDANEKTAELNVIVLKAEEIDANGKKNICDSMPLKDKKRRVKISPQGKTDFGEYSLTPFYLPEKRVKVGDTWKFEDIEYKVEEKLDFKNSAGQFECLKISFDGIIFDQIGTKWVHGYFLFDPEKHLKVKEKTIVERAVSKRIYENELIKIEPEFSGEVDYSCLYPHKELSLRKKLNSAEKYFNKGEYLGSLVLSKAAKKELDEKKDLNKEEKETKKKILSLLTQSYEKTGEEKKALDTRFEYAQFLGQFLSGKKILASDFLYALENYKKLSESKHSKATQSKRKFMDLNARLGGKLKGRVLLSDTGKSDGLTITLLEGEKRVDYVMKGFAQQYSVPIIDLEKENSFKALFHKKFYEPKALPAMKLNDLNLSKEYTVVLKRMQDQNKGYLAGFCYSLTETGTIKQFNDLNFQVFTPEKEFTAQCSDGFYSLLLEPGTYTLSTDQEFEVKAGETTLAHIVE